MVRKTFKNTTTQKQYDIMVLLFCNNKFYILYIYKYIYNIKFFQKKGDALK